MNSPPFDPLAPLPARLSIEASAGTGKTHALSGIAVRALLEGLATPSELLVVTFTRAAADELRDRIRRRLDEVAAALRSPEDTTGAAAAAADPVRGLLGQAACDAQTRGLMEGRALDALAEFDAATVTTIHGFAQQALLGLGTSAPVDLDARLEDDGGLLVTQVTTDVLATYARAPLPGLEKPDLDGLSAVARSVLGNPGIRLAPPDDPRSVGPVAAARSRVVSKVVDGIVSRRLASGAMSFDDLLTRLRDTLERPEAEAAVEAMRRRFRLVLIDEFQDTDPVQWQMFDGLFPVVPTDGGPVGGDGARLVLVGDPKQAIYAFRGADLHTYMKAVSAPGTEARSLSTNWRSDGAVLDALDVLLRGSTFGHDDIRFAKVQPAVGHADRRLRDCAGAALPALSLRLATGPGIHRINGGLCEVDSARDAVTADLVAVTVDLLRNARLPEPGASGPEVRPSDPPGPEVRPSDIAVLVARHADSPVVRDALRRAGVAAVITRGDTVLNSAAAAQWRILLTAMARPGDRRRARAACLSWFVGWSARQLDSAGDEELAAEQDRLRRWADLLTRRGAGELLARVRSETAVVPRLLRGPDGDRDVTDLDHLAELLARYSPRGAGPAVLLEVLDRLGGIEVELDPDAESDLVARRIESESDAVQIMTMHGAKGLEFPIVLCHGLARPPVRRKGSFVFFDPDTRERTIDVAPGVPWPEADGPETDDKAGKAAQNERKRLSRHDEFGQHLRLCYVALTRARHQVVAWWAPTKGMQSSGFSHLLFARGDDPAVDPAVDPDRRLAEKELPRDDAAVTAALAPLVEASSGAISVETIEASTGDERLPVEAEPSRVRSVASLDRRLPRERARWSFSAIASILNLDGLEPDGLEPDGGAHLLAHGSEASGASGPSAEPGPTASDVADRGVDDEPLDALDALDGPYSPIAPDIPVDPGSPLDPDGPGHPEGLPFDPLPAGGRFGSVVHAVLEQVDLATPDRQNALTPIVQAAVRADGIRLDTSALVSALVAVLESPLGPGLGARRLAEIPRCDRLAELWFRLPLDGDRGAGGPSMADLGSLLADGLAVDDPFRTWAVGLAGSPVPARLAGHLVGSIDAVLRVPGPAASEERYVVVDYKTNRLGEPGRPGMIGEYHPDLLPAAMVEHEYPLQALLYQVALHRYLRWRLPCYDPEAHLGGAAYLFVRGMVGDDTPLAGERPYGVCHWRPPAQLVQAVSALLAGEGAPT